jgi:5'(3')-deoxyribonucleotidase
VRLGNALKNKKIKTMKKRHDYRTRIKEMNGEQLTRYIHSLKNNLLNAIGLWDTTRELNVLCYAEQRLKKLQN